MEKKNHYMTILITLFPHERGEKYKRKEKVYIIEMNNAFLVIVIVRDFFLLDETMIEGDVRISFLEILVVKEGLTGRREYIDMHILKAW